jgi:hypothetical protein
MWSSLVNSLPRPRGSSMGENPKLDYVQVFFCSKCILTSQILCNIFLVFSKMTGDFFYSNLNKLCEGENKSLASVSKKKITHLVNKSKNALIELKNLFIL